MGYPSFLTEGDFYPLTPNKVNDASILKTWKPKRLNFLFYPWNICYLS